jgi:hypothetical protein
MNSQDILFIVLAVSTIFIAVPLSMILWRAYKMLDRIEKLLGYADHVRGVAMEFEKMPMRFVEGIVNSFISKKK